jgi:hypothetical protein
MAGAENRAGPVARRDERVRRDVSGEPEIFSQGRADGRFDEMAGRRNEVDGRILR